jgi:hypothetical protein
MYAFLINCENVLLHESAMRVKMNTKFKEVEEEGRRRRKINRRNGSSSPSKTSKSISE